MDSPLRCISLAVFGVRCGINPNHHNLFYSAFTGMSALEAARNQGMGQRPVLSLNLYLLILSYRYAPIPQLGRALGHFIFSLMGLKRILFTNIFQKI